jgi:hypothetical protein
MRETVALLLAFALAGCGGDSPGPSSVSVAGTYPGEFHAILSSTSPVEQESPYGGLVTLTLTSIAGEDYTFSFATTAGGSSAPVSVNGAGAMSFPDFNEVQALDLVGSLTTGVCDATNANATPSGSVVSKQLSFTLLVSGAICDWSGNGTDIRATLIQLIWTGARS